MHSTRQRIVEGFSIVGEIICAIVFSPLWIPIAIVAGIGWCIGVGLPRLIVKAIRPNLDCREKEALVEKIQEVAQHVLLGFFAIPFLPFVLIMYFFIEILPWLWKKAQKRISRALDDWDERRNLAEIGRLEEKRRSLRARIAEGLGRGGFRVATTTESNLDDPSIARNLLNCGGLPSELAPAVQEYCTVCAELAKSLH